MKWVGNSADWNDSFRKFNSSLNIPKWALQRFEYRCCKCGKITHLSVWFQFQRSQNHPLKSLNLLQVWRKSPPQKFESVLHPLNLDPSKVSIQQNDFLKSDRFWLFFNFLSYFKQNEMGFHAKKNSNLEFFFWRSSKSNGIFLKPRGHPCTHVFHCPPIKYIR